MARRRPAGLNKPTSESQGKPSRPIPKQKPIFNGLVIAAVGDMGPRWKSSDIARWVRLRSGKFVETMDSHGVGLAVTHLLCTVEAYKAREPMGGYQVTLASFRG